MNHSTFGPRVSFMAGYDVTVHSTAPPPSVWALLMDATSWPDWSPIDELVAYEPGELGTGGVGRIQTFRTGRAVTSERITALVPERHFGYEGAENFVLKDYRAAIDLEPNLTGGTTIRWHATFTTRRGLNWLMSRYMNRFQARMVSGLSTAAEAR